jgi:DNA-directed RNA polymerase sigma subunit (sigma70/sigma32)
VIAPAANDGVIAPPPRGNVRRPAGKLIDERIEDHDADFAARYPGDPQGDPWQTVRRTLNVVSLDARAGNVGIDPEVEDALASDLGELIPEPEDDEAEKPAPERREAIAQMRRVYSNVLDKREQFVIDMRYHKDGPVPYATIAKACRPRISGRSQVRKIEQRALRKMAERLDKFRNDSTPKPNKSAP